MKTMTEEQIEQNAQEYADSILKVRGKLDLSATIDAFIAGAHSRDYEIGTLKCKVRGLWENIEEQENTIEKLEDKLQKLEGGKK